MIHSHAGRYFYYNENGERTGPYDSIAQALDHFLSHLTTCTNYSAKNLHRHLLDSTITLYAQLRANEISLDEKKDEIDELKYQLSEKQDTIDSLKLHIMAPRETNG